MSDIAIIPLGRDISMGNRRTKKNSLFILANNNAAPLDELLNGFVKGVIKGCQKVALRK